MSLFSSISGIAKSALGSVSKFRDIYDFNPGSLPFPLPPQVEVGLAVARQLSDLTGLDLKIPSPEDLLTSKVQEITTGVNEQVEDVLSKIDWLL